MEKIIDRILSKLDDEQLLHKLSLLSNSDLNSLLLELLKMRSDRISPTDMLKNYKANRFVAPSKINPIEYHELEAKVLSIAKAHEINGVLFSPAAPLGSCSVFGCVDQNNVLSALRGTEILSDPTNMLSIILAEKLKNGNLNNKNPVHYCTTSRVARGQLFSGDASFAHFGLFCIVSSGKDTGSYSCEKSMLMKQLAYYKELLLRGYNAKLSVILRKRSGYTDNDGFFTKMTELVQSELPDTPISFDLSHTDNNYYKGINFKLYMQLNDINIEIGDGGFVDWMQTMTGNRKERCLISAIGLDRLLL